MQIFEYQHFNSKPFEVEIEFEVSKYRNNDKGKRYYAEKIGDTLSYKTEEMKRPILSVQLNDYIDVGIFGENEDGEEEELYLKKHKIKMDFRMDFKSMSIIEKIFGNFSGAPPSEKTEKIFELIVGFGLDDKNYKNRNSVLRSVRDKLKQKTI